MLISLRYLLAAHLHLLTPVLQGHGIKHEAIVTGVRATGVSLDQYPVGQC
ncbi:hypothetical protein [Nitrosomonas mobilis]|nr:hypothetical protein [Nitrosomonas mobilis]